MATAIPTRMATPDRTVIQHNGHTITASARTVQESRRLAKEKVLSFL
jgi:hypothetical protein